jgi:hypothetical protein
VGAGAGAALRAPLVVNAFAAEDLGVPLRAGLAGFFAAGFAVFFAGSFGLLAVPFVVCAAVGASRCQGHRQDEGAGAPAVAGALAEAFVVAFVGAFAALLRWAAFADGAVVRVELLREAGPLAGGAASARPQSHRREEPSVVVDVAGFLSGAAVAAVGVRCRAIEAPSG